MDFIFIINLHTYQLYIFFCFFLFVVFKSATYHLSSDVHFLSYIWFEVICSCIKPIKCEKTKISRSITSKYFPFKHRIFQFPLLITFPHYIFMSSLLSYLVLKLRDLSHLLPLLRYSNTYSKLSWECGRLHQTTPSISLALLTS